MADVKNDPLLIFDFDGAFGPSLQHGQLPKELKEQLGQANEHFPMAVFSGRSTEELIEKLGFRPRFLLADHGLEGIPSWEKGLQKLRKIPQNWRKQIEEHPENLPAHAGVFIENRRSSLALHYRSTPRKHLARRDLLKLVLSLRPIPRVLPGKCVLHLIPDDAPNRFHALEELIRISGAPKALLIGFDKSNPDFFFGLPEKSEWGLSSLAHAKNMLTKWAGRKNLRKFLRELLLETTQKKKGAFAPFPVSAKKSGQNQFLRRNV